ncbi:MAG: PadR family transcriptional regulator [Methanomassiliicoccales archaeon]|nr:PadR family transcriptional regulator [Methanomassiliicoccales archaeon]
MMGKVHNYKGNRISASQLIMMVLLLERPMYGYELLKVLREKYEGIWEPQTGSIYPALRRLQDHGLLDVDNVDGKDNYSLSDEGRGWLEETLGSLSSGVLFMSRTMELLGKVALGEGGRNKYVPLEEEPPETRLRTMLEIRDAMRNNLRWIEEHIKEIEREVG